MNSKSFDDPMPETDEEALTWLPDDPTAKGAYQCYRAMGLDIAPSIINVLNMFLGKKPEYPIPGHER